MAGQLSQEQIEKLDPTIRQKAEAASAKVMAQMSPPGALGLPPKLEAKRLEYGMIDAYFDHCALFEKVFVYQILDDGGDTYGGGLIHRTDQAKDDDRLKAPRGIVVSAGLKAADALMSNGVELGDIVTFTRGAVTRVRVGWVDGHEVWVTVLYVDDISGCLGLAARIRSGELTVKLDATGKHYLGGRGEPALPDFKGNM
jgi:hypothetical protein